MADYWDWGDASSGAATGAAAGAVAGPWGAAIGGAAGGLYGGLSSWLGGPGGRPKEPVKNPYMGQWDALIGQLQKKANGEGPSLAGNAYKEAQQTGMNNVLSMSRGGSAGAARQGVQTLGQMNQGLAQGYSNAKLAEQVAAQQSLQSALSGASGAWSQGNTENRLSEQDALAAKQRQMAMYGQLAQAAATGYSGYQANQRAQEAAKKAAEDEARRRGGY